MKFTTKTENAMAYEEIKEIKSGEVSEYLVKIVFDKEISPEKYSIIWEEPQIDIMGFWSSKAGGQHNITPEWWMRKEESRTASGMPLICLYSKANENRVTVALSDPANPINLYAGVVEETGAIKIKIDLTRPVPSAATIRRRTKLWRTSRAAIPRFF